MNKLAIWSAVGPKEFCPTCNPRGYRKFLRASEATRTEMVRPHRPHRPREGTVMSEISYYDLQAATDNLQRQVWDLENRLERAVDDLRQLNRDSAVDLRGGLADLHDRLVRLEDNIP